MGIAGTYFSYTSGSVDANTDLITKAETLTGVPTINAKKLTLITGGSLAFDINGLGTDSRLYQDTDGLYKLSLDAGDVIVSSLKISQTTGCPVFLAMVF